MKETIMTFTEKEIQSVWEKGKIISPNDGNMWRLDACNAWMHRANYGNHKSKYGWEIDRISPEGSDDISNLRPMQWENMRVKSQGKIVCVVTARGRDNIDIHI